jgi:hypothetical protein
MPCPVTNGFPNAPRKDSPVLLKHRLMTQAQCPCQGWPLTLFRPLLQTMSSSCARFKISIAMVLRIHVFIIRLSISYSAYPRIAVLNPFWLFSRLTAEDKRPATGRTVRGSNPGGGEIFCTSPGRPWGPPSLLCNGYWGSFQEVKWPGRGVHHPPQLEPRLKNQYSNTSTPPLGLHGLF